ncbi:hypothetical protein [Deinococcus roseus]|uniref:Uncharacterized protein n=1 Tax=Deinococcus roseus TaxID=392414 RepID=A0ABQ2DCP1_9DEIO|nr:hypothetical protein [Deinococcus roseus]GGJ53128.1 hypothetical protein GCM10008938_43900 [Deinococcus roseus]
MHILPEKQHIRLVLPSQQANALAWSFITCLNHIKDQTKEVMRVGQEAGTVLVLHFRDQVQKYGEVTLDLLSFQILQKLVQGSRRVRRWQQGSIQSGFSLGEFDEIQYRMTQIKLTLLN